MADVGLRRQVEDDLRSRGRERGADRIELAHVGDVQLGPAQQRLAEPRLRAADEVVGDRDPVAPVEQRVDEVRADEPRAASDEDPH